LETIDGKRVLASAYFLQGRQARIRKSEAAVSAGSAPVGVGRVCVLICCLEELFRRVRAASIRARQLVAAIACAFAAGGLHAQVTQLAAESSPTLDAVVVQGNYDTRIGTTDAASAGTINSTMIQNSPLLRPAEVLEFVPGLVVTQHSGGGKANQYFLRGFNLDHGTDFATFVDGMPINMPTHAHGQGYSDLNWLIPELIDRIDYRKGPYYAQEGDFSSVGSARFRLMDTLPAAIATVTVGQNAYQRLLLARSTDAGSGKLLYAFEANHNNGPWQTPEDLRRINGVLRYSDGDVDNRQSLTLMAYSSRWNATDQIPLRAVDAGLVSRFGAIDNTDGGRTERYSLSYAIRRKDADGLTKANVFAIQSRFDLTSNFTYALQDPVNGDQFQQSERRSTVGADLSRAVPLNFAGLDSLMTFGVQTRTDWLRPVGLYGSVAGARQATLQETNLRQTSVSLYAENLIQWTDWFSSVAGLRTDHFDFNVNSSIAANSGKAQANVTSPKLSLVFGPWSKTEYFVNYGWGFHTNDARGTVASVAPREGTPIASVAPWVRTKGSELGVRTEIVRGLQSSLALWQMTVDSELVFQGDAGDTAPSRASRRQGIEWNAHYIAQPWLLIDADLAISKARYTQFDPAGADIPGSIGKVAALDVTLTDFGPWFGQFQIRYVGPRPLNEDGSQQSASTTIASMRIGYKLNQTMRVSLDVFNLFNRQANDIDYYYISRLAGEPAAGIADRHFHPMESRTARLTLSASF
jgi:outer membrane receptor protein involved in Fe transport